MKKIYKQPLTEVVKINVEQMICESVTFNSTLNTDGSGGSKALSKDDYFENEEDLW